MSTYSTVIILNIMDISINITLKYFWLDIRCHILNEMFSSHYFYLDLSYVFNFWEKVFIKNEQAYS